MPTTQLTETSPELREALAQEMLDYFGTEIFVGPVNTGGGTMVLCVDLSQDGRGMGRQAWLTREDEWYLGFYDYALENDDGNDEGVCVSLLTAANNIDDPAFIADQVGRILRRLGVTLQGS